ncbi:hypothetical protein PS627_03101 [Pseudomonas fluorescens]|uniref:hypothetical protein n=1 Tax=Pseudomonas fluorescens TaxID=294 RepID=UPI001257B768|nr:hypothetical protein [Pseudomonas fluorescens]CAG8868720.1 hypothetical protein PS627_03101 [Pseudomonas fluorescens]VVP68658.1 hypothetical protein PS910_00408 [Pseudomonas fluorescens]
MAWVVQLTDSEGNVLYSSGLSSSGTRVVCSAAIEAETFDSEAKARSMFFWIHRNADLQRFDLKAVSLPAFDQDGVASTPLMKSGIALRGLLGGHTRTR